MSRAGAIRAILSRSGLGDIIRLLFYKIDTTDPRRRRRLGVLQGVVTKLGNRVVGMAVSFLSVPLTIGYLGEHQDLWGLCCLGLSGVSRRIRGLEIRASPYNVMKTTG